MCYNIVVIKLCKENCNAGITQRFNRRFFEIRGKAD